MKEESKIIEITPQLDLRVYERRQSVRDALYKRDRTIRRLRASMPYWLDAVAEEEAAYEAAPSRGHACLMVYRERLHLMREILADLGELVEPCSCGYCERKRKEETNGK